MQEYGGARRSAPKATCEAARPSSRSSRVSAIGEAGIRSRADADSAPWPEIRRRLYYRRSETFWREGELAAHRQLKPAVGHLAFHEILLWLKDLRVPPGKKAIRRRAEPAYSAPGVAPVRLTSATAIPLVRTARASWRCPRSSFERSARRGRVRGRSPCASSTAEGSSVPALSA